MNFVCGFLKVFLVLGYSSDDMDAKFDKVVPKNGEDDGVDQLTKNMGHLSRVCDCYFEFVLCFCRICVHLMGGLISCHFFCVFNSFR